MERDCLHKDARPIDQFHLEYTPPVMTAWGSDYLFRRVHWTLERGVFASYIVAWFIRWYWGTAKVDGTRTHAYRAGQLCPEREDLRRAVAYVVTTTPSEMVSFRIRWRRPSRERWDNMGGI